jgi:hypothetical protein
MSVFYWAAGLVRGALLKEESRASIRADLQADVHLAYGVGALVEELWHLLPAEVRRKLVTEGKMDEKDPEARGQWGGKPR